MPYIGKQAAAGQTETVKDSFNGDNSTTAFTMSQSVSLDTDIEVFVGNVQQEPGSGKAYTVSGTTLTFSEAPPTGTGNIYVIHRNSLQGTLLPPQNLGDRNYLIGGNLSLDADSAALNFGADSDITLTHSADTGLVLKNTSTSGNSGIGAVLTLQTGDTDIAQDDVLGKIQFQAPDEATGTDAILVAAGISAISEGDFSSSSNATALHFLTGASEAASSKMVLTSGGDLKVKTDGASIFFGADNEIELRHVADTGLILKHTATADDSFPTLTLQTGDTDIAVNDSLGRIAFQAPDEGAGTDAILVAASIDAISEGDFSSSNNATTLDFQVGASAASRSDGDGARLRLTSAGELHLKPVSDTDGNFPIIQLQSPESAIETDDPIGEIQFLPPDEGSGTDAILVSAGIQAKAESAFGSSTNATSLDFKTASSEAATRKMSLSSGGDLSLLTDGASMFFGADSEIELRHVADTGLILKAVGTADDTTPSLTFQAGDNDIALGDILGKISFQAPDEGAGTDAILVGAELVAVSEGDFSASSNATSLVFKTASSAAANEKMRINSDGAIAIGTGTPNNFSGFQCMTLGGSAATTGSLIDLEDSSGNIDGRVSGEEGNLLLGADPSAATGSSKITLQVDGTERAKIENTGKLSVFGDSSAQVGLLQNADSSPYGQQISFSAAAPNNTTNWFLSCNDNSAQNFIVFSSGTAKNSTGTYTSFSDERLKSNIVDAKSQWEDIKALKFKNFNKFDNPDLKQLGLIAQDVEKTSANLVFETPPNEFEIKHSSDFGTLYEDGDTIPEGKKIGDVKEVKSNVKNVKDSILYMKAVKALQEAMTRIETLETKVKALEDA